jgi:type II secretory pathway pseudopilin PulG
MKRNLKVKKGSALLVTIFVATLISIISVALLNLYMNEIRIKNRSEEKIQAKYIAEAGLEHGIAEINNSISESLVSTFYNEKNFNIAIEIKENNLFDKGNIKGDYTAAFYDNENKKLNDIYFNVINIAPKDEEPIYVVNSVEPSEFTVVSQGNLKDSSGKVLNTVTMEAKVRFQIDYANKKITKIDILQWQEKKS